MKRIGLTFFVSLNIYVCAAIYAWLVISKIRLAILILPLLRQEAAVLDNKLIFESNMQLCHLCFMILINAIWAIGTCQGRQPKPAKEEPEQAQWGILWHLRVILEFIDGGCIIDRRRVIRWAALNILLVTDGDDLIELGLVEYVWCDNCHGWQRARMCSDLEYLSSDMGICKNWLLPYHMSPRSIIRQHLTFPKNRYSGITWTIEISSAFLKVDRGGFHG